MGVVGMFADPDSASDAEDGNKGNGGGWRVVAILICRGKDNI